MNYSIKRQLLNEEQVKLAGHSPLLAHLLFHRGIFNREVAEKFLSPDYSRDMHDPFLLKDAEKAAERVIQAVKNNERVAIYADYDADGIPGAAMFSDFFNKIGFKNFSVYIPHRHDEGFGLNKEAIEQLASESVKLVITIDCGIADFEPVKRANELKMNVIITDHHEPPEKLPPAFAIVDQKQTDCAYPDKNLCGTAVAFKLIQGILAKNRFGLKDGHEKWFLDLVGIATISDMVPLTGENKVFAHYGLTVLRKSPRKGLSRLFEKLRISRKHLTEDDISFMITPRINAASRMGVPMDAFKLLSAETDADAEFYANHLDHINNERKGVVASLVKEVRRTIKERFGSIPSAAPVEAATSVDFGPSLESARDEGQTKTLRRAEEGAVSVNRISVLPSVIVLGNPLWRPSLLGLVANTCAEEFNRPVFLWGRDGDNVIKGSCRSEGSTNMFELMRSVPDGTFTQFGGHRHSGGFAVANGAVHYLEQRLNEIMQVIPAEARIRDSDINEIDTELTLDSVNWHIYNDIVRLAPFGVGNPKPTFLFRNITPNAIRRFGRGSEHIELIFKKISGERVSAISFFGAESGWAKSVQSGKPIDLVASLEKSVFRGESELRLRVVNMIMK